MKTKNIIIEAKSPFGNCKLNREQYASVLTSIVDAYKDGFVLSVNGKWGTGKTTFMKMWRQSLVDNGYKTVFFNAWENDFVSEPLVAILGEMRGAFKDKRNGKTKETLTSIIGKAGKFSGKILPAVAKTAATLAGFPVGDIAEALSEATVDAFNDEIAEYDQKKNTLIELKRDLSEFIEENCGDKPLVFIIDELDRCRPDYAVEVLEKIKHFFSVPGVVFVLSVDKEQLCNSVRGYYGSDKIDSPEYLRRFIDIEYTIPAPNYEQFCKHLYNECRFDEFFKSEERVKYEFHDKEFLLKTSNIIASAKRLSLRQIEKLFIQMRIAIRLFGSKQYMYPDLLFLIIYIKHFYSEVYQKIITQQLTIQELVEYIEIAFELNIREEKERECAQNFHFTVARLLNFYKNTLPIETNPLITTTTTTTSGEYKLSFKVRALEENKILGAITYMNKQTHNHGLKLTHFTSKIDLLESLKS